MNKQSGFTLIELVMVIVILGILAATALPKFVDLSTEAANASAHAAAGAVSMASETNFAKVKAGGSGTPIISGTSTCTTVGGLMSGGTISAQDSNITWVTAGNTVTCTNSLDTTSCYVKHASGSAAGYPASIMCTQ